LWDKDFYTTNGIYVEKTRNVLILGHELMDVGSGKAISSMNRRYKDELLG
jgi:hypothetical protein